MGPEHSSARLERFLSLAAGDNLQIVSPTNPAQYFHCLRRQALRRWRKPLVVMTPKGLLRHPAAVSRLEDCASGHFQRVLADTRSIDNAARILLCSGKIYYELEAFREKGGRNDAALARVEQLYPFPEEPLRAALQHYRDGTPVLWVQEEPKNMGAWSYLREKFGEKLFGRFPLSVVSRPERASPATGSASRHKQEQEQLVERAFAVGTSQPKDKDNRKESYENFSQRPNPWPHFRRHRLLVYPEQGAGAS
jgi:2-oxoglutarate dehydrogenase E1 component